MLTGGTVYGQHNKRTIRRAFPGIDDKYIEKAFEKLGRNGCPDGEDSLTWLGKLIVAEILADAMEK